VRHRGHGIVELFCPQPVELRLLTLKRPAMRFQTYRDQTHSRHLHLIGGGVDPWSIDLVSVVASGLLVAGLVCALLVPLVR
jgi:hypothetical protein